MKLLTELNEIEIMIGENKINISKYNYSEPIEDIIIEHFHKIAVLINYYHRFAITSHDNVDVFKINIVEYSFKNYGNLHKILIEWLVKTDFFESIYEER
jgi:hypothetical protein